MNCLKGELFLPFFVFILKGIQHEFRNYQKVVTNQRQ